VAKVEVSQVRTEIVADSAYIYISECAIPVGMTLHSPNDLLVQDSGTKLAVDWAISHAGIHFQCSKSAAVTICMPSVSERKENLGLQWRYSTTRKNSKGRLKTEG
jgi:hypothetical protein